MCFYVFSYAATHKCLNFMVTCCALVAAFAYSMFAKLNHSRMLELHPLNRIRHVYIHISMLPRTWWNKQEGSQCCGQECRKSSSHKYSLHFAPLGIKSLCEMLYAAVLCGDNTLPLAYRQHIVLPTTSFSFGIYMCHICVAPGVDLMLF